MPKAGGKGKKGVAIVIRREEVVEGGHHGGAWKVAYADFVTAMMAFFLLMWLINATSDKQRRGIADYFSPQGVHARSLSGSGKPFGGLTPFSKGALVSNLGSVNLTDRTAPSDASPGGDEDPDAIDPPSPSPPSAPDRGVPAAGRQAQAAVAPAPQTDPDAVPINGVGHQDGNAGRGTAASDDGHAGDPVPVRRLPPKVSPSGTSSGTDGSRVPGAPDDAASFRTAAQALRRSVSEDPSLADVGDQLRVDVTPDGLRIQIVDTERSPMFDNGSAVPNARARLLLGKVAPVLASLGDPVSITGHTDSTPPLGASARSNWALSAARADATRMVLDRGGLADERITGVIGVADHDPLVRGDADAAANRRVVMVVHRHAPGSDAPAAGH